ncbi:hypothetical protein OSTOST_18988 [Ostertagia ostertagi]
MVSATTRAIPSRQRRRCRHRMRSDGQRHRTGPVCLASGYSVNLYGRSEETRVAAKNQIRRGLVKNAQKKRGDEVSPVDTVEQSVDIQMRQLTLCADIRSAVANAIYIIEAIVEKKEAKEAVFAEAQNHCPS